MTWLNKERVVFVLASLLALWAVVGALRYEPPRLRLPPGKRASPPPAPYVPPLLAWPRGGLPVEEGRDLFAQPVEWQRLPPLTLAPPPLLAPPLVAPPPDPGPAPRFWRGLRHVLAPEPVAASAPAGADANAAGGKATTLAERPAPPPEQVYDQVVPKGARGPLYGRIRNPDPLALAAGERDGVENHLMLKPGVRLEFDHYDPATGKRRGVSTYTAADLEYFSLAATDENLYALKRWRLRPGDLDGRLALARWLRDRGHVAWAAREYREVLRRDPRNEAVVLELGLTLENAFLWEEALAVYAAARQRGLEEPELLYREGQVLRGLRLYGQAETRFRRALALERGDPRLHLALGLCLAERGRAAAALPYLEQAQAATTPGGRARMAQVWARAAAGRGRVLLWLGRLDEAQTAFQAVLDQAPESDAAGEARLGLGAVAYARGTRADLERALEVWRAGSPPPLGRPFLLHRGLARARLGQYQAAQALLEKALTADPLRCDLAHAGLGFAAECQGRAEEALEHYEAAAMANPGRLYVLLARGRVLRQRGELEEAREVLTQALRRAPDAVDVLLELGTVELLAEKAREALTYLERARTLEPDTAAVDLLYGAALLRAGREAEALQWAEGVLARRPEDPVALAQAAVLYYRRGEVARALGSLEAAAQAGAAHKRYAALVRYARETAAAIRANEQRRLWRDDFNRQEIKRGWVAERHGALQVRLVGGRVRLGGLQEAGNTAAALRRRVNLGELERFEVDLDARGARGATVGVEVTVPLRGRGERRLLRAALQWGVGPQGELVYRVYGEEGFGPWQATGRRAPADRAIRLGFERVDALGQAWRLLLDGDPVGKPVTVPGFRGWDREVELGVFGAARIGVRWQAEVDNVEILLQLKDER